MGWNKAGLPKFEKLKGFNFDSLQVLILVPFYPHRDQ